MTIKEVKFACGMLSHPRDAAKLPVHSWRMSELPEEVQKQLAADRPWELPGQYGSPFGAKPIQYHDVRLVTDEGECRIEVFNLALLILGRDDEETRRIFRCCHTLEKLTDSPAPARPDRIEFTITEHDREVLLYVITGLPDMLVDRLHYGQVRDGGIAMRLPTPVFEQWLGVLLALVDAAPDPEIGEWAQDLYERMSVHSPLDLDSGNPFQELLQEVHEHFRENPSTTMDEANVWLEGYMRERNERPRDEFLGLSSEQVSRLIHQAPEGAHPLIVYHTGLSLEDVGHAPIFRNARTLLSALRDEAGTRTTAAGNLNRKFVRQMAESFEYVHPLWKDTIRRQRTLNEEDIGPLSHLRYVLGFAGLIRKAKGRFQITKSGKSLLADDRAGELYGLLFRTYFEKFNLAALDGMPEHIAVQTTFPFSLWALHKVAGDWIEMDELAEIVILPGVRDEIEKSSPPGFGDCHKHLARSRIVRPLIEFGLLEARYDDDEGYRLTAMHKTPWFDAFIQFQVP